MRADDRAYARRVGLLLREHIADRISPRSSDDGGRGAVERELRRRREASRISDAGSVDLGLIGTFVLFHVPAATAAAAVVAYRLIQLWIPALLGGISLTRLRSTLTADEATADITSG
jgi:hypothetical protein